MSEAESGAYPGMEALERLFRSTVPRPRRGDRALPIIWLGGDPANVEGTFTTLGAAASAAVQIECDPTAPADLPDGVSVSENTAPGLTDMRRLMATLCRALSGDRFGRLRPLRFRRYRLVEWLMSQKLTSDDEIGELAGLLRREFPQWGRELLSTAEPLASPTQRLVAAAVRLVLPAAVFRARISGRIPGVGREFRWFMRQQYLAPRQSSRFIGFAQRLTENGRGFELGDQLAKLLIHAFLEDLRVSYRRGPGRILAARRTTYPLVRLRHGDLEPAARFLRLVNEIRNETGRDDPLLIVTTTTKTSTGANTHPATESQRAYELWIEDLPIARHRQQDHAWSLELRIPPATSGNPIRFRRIPVPRPPWWARRAAPILAAAAAVVLACAAGIWAIRSPTHVPCPAGPATEWVSVTTAHGICVGYSAYDPDDPAGHGQGYLFASAEPRGGRLVAAQKLVYRQNRTAEQAAARQPGRRLLTLVYFGQLGGLPGDYAAESEDLEGIALAQHEDNEERAQAGSPLIRVVLADTGPGIVDGPQVVRMLTPLIQRGELIGAVGLDESRTPTITMIGELTALGLPVIGASLSGDVLPTTSAMYFQVAPPDRVMADMIGQYLADHPEQFADKNVRIYDQPTVSDPTDLYTGDMVRDLTSTLADGSRRVVDNRRWHDWDAFTRDGKSICDTDVLFFAGRDQDFPDFLGTVEGDSGCHHQKVTLMADDSANRFMASRAARQSSNSSQSLVYMAKASLATCRNQGNEPGDANAGQEFYSAATQYLNACADNTAHPLGERVALTYDAISLYDDAVQWLSASAPPTAPAIPVTSTTVWAALLQLPQPITLTSGILQWAAPTQGLLGRIDPDKWRGLLRVDHIWNTDTSSPDDPTLIFGCGSISTPPVDAGCYPIRPNPH
jgi:ABC-type branched-subunit amino acid transport system substrate-binding protein